MHTLVTHLTHCAHTHTCAWHIKHIKSVSVTHANTSETLRTHVQHIWNTWQLRTHNCNTTDKTVSAINHLWANWHPTGLGCQIGYCASGTWGGGGGTTKGLGCHYIWVDYLSTFLHHTCTLVEYDFCAVHPLDLSKYILNPSMYPCGYSVPTNPQNPQPIPIKTCTLVVGQGFWCIRVQVDINLPWVYPCQSLR